MIRLFKHYIPHAVLLLGLFDIVLLILAGEVAWVVRASQIDMDPGRFSDRFHALAGAAVVVLTMMVAVGVYGADALRSMRFASARLLVAISLGVIALAFIDFLIPGQTFCRSTLAYAMGFSIVLLILNRLVVGGILGASAFRRRVLVLGAGLRAQRLKT
ncbi:MAG: sugar transferase, partial [Proteobacteria bacterium]